ncbi:NADH-quinone oxidoreductase subunit I 2-like [Diorhabda sublineata]|uniref:NADH-quinone oxidoreductase subunit I 2-like n=1 Tax=Diorhabda sublineata TaxID=1163346 RepID=UPI0024E0A906|nr:NADH-quinone oxidoreductase subunit I 2-like [Diorhabda sublineata]
MFQYVIFLALAAAALADPVAKPDPSFVAAPLAVAPAVVTAQSSQVFARQYNALATGVAPLVAAAPYAAAPLVAAPAAPLVAAPAAPLIASYRYASPYVAAPLL